MILHADQGFKGRIIDLEEGREVPRVVWVDLDRGELEAAFTDERGELVRDGEGNVKTYRAKGRFKFIPREPKGRAVILWGAARCTSCSSPLTLPGRDLCPRCNAADKGIKAMCGRMLETPLLDVRCQGKTPAGYRCSALAVIQVGDEVSTTPQRVRRVSWTRGAVLFDRAQIVRQRFYCQRCYKAPALLDAKGEVVREFSEAI